MDSKILLSPTGLTVSAYTPLIDISGARVYIPRGRLFDSNMNDRIISYAHELSNDWGYKSIPLVLGGTQDYLDEWFENGLGRHIEVNNTYGQIIASGFVNRVTTISNTLQASRGPLVEVCNRASVVYTPIIDVSVSPPLTGAVKSTIITEDDDSQNKYGIIEKVISGGQLLDDGTTNEAEDYRDRYLDGTKEPSTGDKSLSLGSSSQPSIQLEVLGYYAWFDLYVYTNVTTLTTTMTTKMQAVFAADPNDIFSTDYADVEDNNLLVANYDNDNRTAKSILEEMVKRGNDVDDQRRVFGVFENQKIYYNTIPNNYEYYYKVSGRNQNIWLYSGGETGAVVNPWDVKAGRWLFIGDFLPGRFSDFTNKKDDPRSMFIESVSFSAPHGLSINGIGVSELAQYLAKLGVS